MNKSVSILMVDDDLDDQELFLEASQEVNKGISCVSVFNGLEALDYLKSNPLSLPDYIFLDLNMPVMNGMECLAAIKRSNALSHIPVIIYSTTSDATYQKDARKLGTLQFITKPVHFEDICRCIKEVVEKFPVPNNPIAQ